MAPEHLEAVSIGEDDRLDARADVFSLGVLLFEALTGSRPFPAPVGQLGPRGAPPGGRGPSRRPRPGSASDHPEIPAALERVIRRCLEPDPADRFPDAAELAADLQAVADDAPLRSTREPLPVRAVRRARRSWKKLVAGRPCVAGSAVALAMSAAPRGGRAGPGRRDRLATCSTRAKARSAARTSPTAWPGSTRSPG